MKWGYHLPHLRSGDLNPGSLGSLPRAPQGVGRAGSEPRWVTPLSSLWPRCHVAHLAAAAYVIAFWKAAKTPVDTSFMPQWMRERLKSESCLSEPGLLVHRSPRTARTRSWARPSTYGTNTAGPRSTLPEHSRRCGQQPGLLSAFFSPLGTWPTELIMGFLLWCSKCNCFSSKIA